MASGAHTRGRDWQCGWTSGVQLLPDCGCDVPRGWPEGAEWLILDQNGEGVATATTPPGLHVLEIGSDYVLGTARDEYDVESVRMHRLAR